MKFQLRRYLSVALRNTVCWHLMLGISMAIIGMTLNSAAFADRRTTGTVGVPGTGTIFNDSVKYTVTLKKVPGTKSKLTFWLHIKNPNNKDIDMIACAMVRLNRDKVSMPQYNVKKENNVWTCTRDGNVMEPPSYHFGCKRITVPANKSEYAFDATYDIGTEFEESELTAIYWDVLQAKDGGKDCTLSQSCIDALNIPNGRMNVNLGPDRQSTRAITDSALNIWGGNIANPETLSAVQSKRGRAGYRVSGIVETGNWSTMAFGGQYPAILTGTLTNAEPGALFAIDFPDGTEYAVTVPADGNVEIFTEMLVPDDSSAVMRFSMETDEPIPDGNCASCALDVIAATTTEIYEEGAIMHSIGLSFPGDMTPPSIDSVQVNVQPDTGMLNFDVMASDTSTMAAAASVQTTVDGVTEVFALTFGIPEDRPQTVDETQFVGEVGPFEPGSTVTYEVLVVDVLGNLATSKAATVTIGDSDGKPEFDLRIPEGIGLVHIPWEVTAVGDQAMEINTVGDLFDVLGEDNVNFIITYQPPEGSTPGAWRSYLGEQSRRTAADRMITDNLGIVTVMKKAITLRMKGTALGLGSDGKSEIKLHRGINVVGVPLKDERLKRVSDLLTLEGIKDNATSIIVLDAGQFKVVARQGDDGDIDITGGQSFIITARSAGVAEIIGVAWDNVSEGTAAAPPMTVVGHKVDGGSPVLAVHGAVVDQGTGLAKNGFRVTVKNLSTGAMLSTLAGSDTPLGNYGVTFVDLPQVERSEISISWGGAAQVGDILLITVQTPSPFSRVQPLRYIVSAADVERSHIHLPDLMAYEIPTETKLLPNYPNPFNPETWIPFRLAKDSKVTLVIYDIKGQIVRTIFVGHTYAAVYESRDRAIHWDGRNDKGEQVSSSVYFYHLKAGDFQSTRKMIIIK